MPGAAPVTWGGRGADAAAEVIAGGPDAARPSRQPRHSPGAAPLGWPAWFARSASRAVCRRL